MTHPRLAAAVELLRTNPRYRRYALARISSTIGSTVAPWDWRSRSWTSAAAPRRSAWC
ncbi:hypothetical protein ACFQQB_44730 [Nonomuraea rubra]|uniref:hypothetical protein n=1 Tax=Nonomuraea rubra TaxID=46180 RepID=UPI00361E3C68